MPDSPRLSRRTSWASGQPISELMSRALDNPGLISLAAGFVDPATLPDEAVRIAAASVLEDSTAARAALQYGSTAGLGPLRRRLLDRLLASDHFVGAPPSLDQLVVTAGSNQLLQLVLESLLDPGDRLLCAAPTYLVVLGIVQNLGAVAEGIGIDAEGMRPDALDERLAAHARAGELERVRGVYLVSYFDNPAGTTAGAERRRELLAVVDRWSGEAGRRIPILEDAAYRELRFEGENPPSLWSLDESSEGVGYFGTFSKSFSPGLRIGWGLLPTWLVGPVLDLKNNADFGSPNLNQWIADRVLQLGLDGPQAERLRGAYRAKRDAMLAALDEHMADISGAKWRRPEGGLYVWLELDEAIDTGPDGLLWQESLGRGVIYVPGQFCFPADTPRRNGMRLSFGVESPERIRRGIELLAAAVRGVG